MNTYIKIIYFSLIFTFLQAEQSIFISPKVALKMVDKKSVLFISLDKSSLEIKKSKYIDLATLPSFDILGRLDCPTMYICPKELEKFFSTLDIDPKQPLIIYDDSYGIKAATLYTILESIGHENMAILRGGVADIKALDPNWEIYSTSLIKLRELVALTQQDTNQTLLNEYASKINSLEKKVRVLKPHLLIQKRRLIEYEHKDINYTISNVHQDYFLSKEKFEQILNTFDANETNVSIVDVCDMGDILGIASLDEAKSIPWSSLINKDAKHLKSNELLEKFFVEQGLNKKNDNYLYCMSGAQKAFFVMLALREVGYMKVKVFVGDWNVWIGEMNE